MVDIQRLHYFCVVAQVGNLSKAAEMLNISQAGLSKAMKVLQDEIGEILFIPAGRGIAITDKGKKLVEESLPLIEKVQGLKASINEQKEDRVVVRLGSFEVFTTYFLEDLTSGVFRDFELNVYELIPGEIEMALKAGRIDLGVTYLPIPDPDLDFLKVTSIGMGVFVKKGSFKGVNPLDLPYIVPNVPVKGTPSKVSGLDGWPDDRLPRKIKHRVAMLEGALSLCRVGEGAGFFPKFVVDRHNQHLKEEAHLEEIKIPSSLKVQSKQDVYVIKRRSDTEGELTKKLSKQLRLLKK